MSVYIAAASSDHERVARWVRIIRANADLKLRSSWVDTAHKWAGQDARMPLEDQRNVANHDLQELLNSTIIWQLAPSTPSAGASTELGAALVLRKTVIVSGPACANSIFTSLATKRFYSDEDAYRELVRIACAQTQPMTQVGRRVAR